VAQLVDALLYKPESRGGRLPVVSMKFFFDVFLPGRTLALGSTQPLTEMSNYQEYLLRGKGCRFVGLTTLPHSCADCFEIWEPQPPGTLRACPGME
jgi:hypothetical protein